MSQVDLNHVTAFVRVVEDASFTAAAKSLGVPKSTVSRAVSKLEEELDVRLLHRTTRKLSLTEAGQAFYDRVRQAIGGIEDAISAAHEAGKTPRGTVRVTAPVDLGTLLLADVVARFVRKYPQIRVELTLTSRVVDLVEEGFDLALRAARLDDSTLIARKLGSSSMGVFASPHYLERKKRPESPADLDAHECILFRAKNGRATWSLTGPAGVEEIEVRGAITADDVLFVQRAILAGAGLGLLPIFLARTCPERDSLVRVLPNFAVRGALVQLVTPSVRNEPARVALFRDFLVASIRAIEWDS
jgi:DNA-binding transcriptional LysR family regulator